MTREVTSPASRPHKNAIDQMTPYAQRAAAMLLACVSNSCVITSTENPVGAATDGYEIFFIEEQGAYPFPIGSCQSDTPVSYWGDSLDGALRGRGWVGTRAMDPSDQCGGAKPHCAEPADFAESQDVHTYGLVGKDHLWADAATLSVFMGHGTHNLIAYRRPTITPTATEVCQLNFSDGIRLGYAGGNKTRVALFAASCVGFAADLLDPDDGDDFLDGLGKRHSWQFLTFYDSPSLDDLMFPNFVTLLSKGDPNYLAWIGATYLNPPNDYNQPIVYTTYNAAADVASRWTILELVTRILPS